MLFYKIRWLPLIPAAMRLISYIRQAPVFVCVLCLGTAGVEEKYARGKTTLPLFMDVFVNQKLVQNPVVLTVVGGVVFKLVLSLREVHIKQINT